MMADGRRGASSDPFDDVARALERVDAAMRADDAEAMGDCFAPDARLLWPEIEDIVGRDAIRAAFEGLMAALHTVSWEAEYQVLDVHDDRAYVLGRFREVRRDRESGEIEQVPGRIVYFWRRQPDGQWLITHLLTGRYGPETAEAEDG